MTAIEIARRMAELGQQHEALRAYTLAAHEGGLTPEEELEAAVFILQAGGNYEISYACFLNLYRQGHYQEETITLLTGAFYEPNEKTLRNRYEQNVKLLKKYSYLFRKDFLPFEELPIQFYPYSDNSYIPFYSDRREFGEFIDIKKQVISRNFFKDLEKPILAADVYSQYELEYLRDNVRKSEYVARENHIYLHYTNWEIFCAWLQVLDMRPLLKEEKIVFLIEDEISQYPIDFKERFGIDYSRFSLKPVGIREISRMIWTTQLLSHNGINFFNEILDGHPNLLCHPALMFTSVLDEISKWKENVKEIHSTNQFREDGSVGARIQKELFLIKGQTDKDILISGYLGNERCVSTLDPAARITPALLFSPHFSNIDYRLRVDTKQNLTVLYSPQYAEIQASQIFKSFKYVKVVAPFRRPTVSSAASVRFMHENAKTSWNDLENDLSKFVGDDVTKRVLNRSFMYNWQDRLMQDSVVVRFEDGKLNPKATFTALAEFLDLPYTESLTYCSNFGTRDPEAIKGDAIGFDLKAVYASYPDYLGESERYFIEYFLRDVYKTYGYDFLHYDGQPVDEAKVEKLCTHFDIIDGLIAEAYMHAKVSGSEIDGMPLSEIPEEEFDKAHRMLVEEMASKNLENRLKIGKTLLRGLHFINNYGQPLRMMPLLKLDPALLEQPLYH